MKFQLNELYEAYRVDPSAIDDLYPAIRRLARLVAVSLLNNEYGELDDVVSDAAIMIWQDITNPSFVLRTAKFHTWCLHALRHFFFRWASTQRGRRRTNSIDAFVYADEDGQGVEGHDLIGYMDNHIEALTLLTEVAAILNTEERTLLRGLYEGRTMQEMANQLGTYKMDVSRKIRAIKEKLKKH